MDVDQSVDIGSVQEWSATTELFYRARDTFTCFEIGQNSAEVLQCADHKHVSRLKVKNVEKQQQSRDMLLEDSHSLVLHLDHGFGERLESN